MTVHRVYSLPKEGAYVRCVCGHKTNDIKSMAVDRADAPEGAELCRKCWRDVAGTSPRGKVALIRQVAEEIGKDGFVPVADLIAILEDRYYPADKSESPKAA